jgi:hypothetical protein
MRGTLCATTLRGAAFLAGLALAFFKTTFFLAAGFFLAATRDLVVFLGFAIANLTSRVVHAEKPEIIR